MRGLFKLTWVEIKLFLREPVGAFFTFAFPLLLLLLLGGLVGNAPNPRLGGLGIVDVAVPAYAALMIAIAGLLGVSTVMATYRERGILRRLHATPLRPHAVLAAQAMVMFVMTAVGMALLLLVGRSLYELRFAGSVLNVLAAFVLGSTSFFAIGFVLASVVPTVRTAQVVAMTIFYPMIFLSGAVIPLHLLPGWVRPYTLALPLTHVVTLLQGMWMGEGWGVHLGDVAVLAAITVGGVVFSARSFRWE